MKRGKSLLLHDNLSCERRSQCISEASLTSTLQRAYDHGAVGAGRGKHLSLSQKRRERCPKAVILTFIELHLKELVVIFQKDRMEKDPPFLHTVVPPYLWGRRSQIPSGCLRPQIVPNPTNTMFSFIYTQLW